MRRPLVLCALAALFLSGTAQAGGGRVTAFYYPWYGTPALDGAYQHWSQDGHNPPDDIASAFYPVPASTRPPTCSWSRSRCRRSEDAGIDEIAVSWWGRGSAEDGRLGAVAAAARAAGIAVAVHLEPYAGRTVAGTVADVAYLESTYGVKTFYVYRPFDFTVADWAAAAQALHSGGGTLFAQTALVGAAAAAGFDGVYTYDIVTYGGDKFARLCHEAHHMHLLCAPSVGPGYDARRADGRSQGETAHVTA